MNEDAYLDAFMEDRLMGGAENYWEDDLYQYNLNEADDYRFEMDDSDFDDDFGNDFDYAE